MVEEGNTVIHLKIPEVSEEPQDIDANFTGDTSPIVYFNLDLGVSSYVTRDHSLISSFKQDFHQ